MNLAFLDRNRSRVDYAPQVVEPLGATLRVVPSPEPRGWEPRIVRNGDDLAPELGTNDQVIAKAEIRAKRFSGNRMNEERFTATVAAADGSPNALLAALSRAFAEVDEFRVSRGSDERVILQVSLIL
jgi:hypothetical protein